MRREPHVRICEGLGAKLPRATRRIAGIIAPRALAERITDEIRWFLRDQLKLELSAEKTLITHAKTERANFLGMQLRIGRSRTGEGKVALINRPDKRLFRRRVTGYFPHLLVPVKKLIVKLQAKGFCDKEGWPISKAGWTGLDADQLIMLYNANCEPTADRSGGKDVFRTPHRYAERLWGPTAAAPLGVG